MGPARVFAVVATPGLEATAKHKFIGVKCVLVIFRRPVPVLCSLLLLLTVSCKRPEYETGQMVFEGECVKCHKLNGNGGDKGPELDGIFIKKDEQYVRTYTIDPRSIKPDSTMPPSKLSQRELDLLINFLKQHSLIED